MENEQLSRELQELKNRLTRIEEKLGVGTENLVSSEDRTKSKPPEQEFPLLIKKAKSQSAPKRDSNLLGAVGVFFFILAASFFIKLAIDSGWLTPLRQFTGAVIFGCSLIALGFKLKKRDLEYSALLPGAGVVVLFMSAYAGHLYYQLYSSSIAIFLAAAISLLSLYLFTFFAYELFLVVAIVGTYLVPLLISDVSASLAGICLYFLFWAVLYCLCAIYLKRRLLISVASYFAIVVFQFALFEVVKLPQTESLNWGILLQVIQFVLFSGAIFLFSVRWKQELTSGEAWSLFPALFIFYGFEYSMIDKLYPQLAPWVSLGFAAFIFVLYFTAKRLLNKTTLVSAPMIATFVAAISFHAIYLNLWPKDFSVELGLISLALIAVLKRIGIDTKRFELAFACLWIIVGIEFLVSLGAGRAENFHFMFTNLAFVGLIAYAYSKQKNEGSSFWLLVFASMQSLCALNRISELLVSRTIQDYFTSGLWGIFALLLLTLGFSKRDGMLAKCAVFILWLVSAKVLFLDLSGSSQIVRIITLCLVGAIIYAGGLILKRFKQLEA